MIDRVGLVGWGAHLKAVAHLLDYNDREVYVVDELFSSGDWDMDDDKLEFVDLEAVSDLPLVFFEAPMQSARQIASRLGDCLSGRHAVVHASRSLEVSGLQTLSGILEEETPTRRIGFLTGPIHSDDITAGRAGSGVCASHFPEVHRMVEQVLESDRFLVYRTDDLIGAEVSAIYSRILAVAMGMARQLGLGNSLEATLFSRGLSEMTRFVDHWGGVADTAFGLGGCGNLKADVLEPVAPAFELGRWVAKEQMAPEGSLGEVARDMKSLVSVMVEKIDTQKNELNILESVGYLVSGERTPDEAMDRLLTLPTDYE